MDNVTALPLANEQFAAVLATVTPAHLELVTPCEGWTVTDLLSHVVGGTTMAAAIVRGASRDEAIAVLGSTALSEDPMTQFRATTDDLAAAIAEPGALERTVAHPAMDMPAAQLLGFRVGDLLVHSWDLSCALGSEIDLDPEVVEVVWTNIQPMLPFIGSIGMFGDGPSGNVADDAPLHLRLLDAMGRRP